MKQQHLPPKADETASIQKSKIIMTIFWGLFLCLNTWTDSLEQLLDLRSVGFRWVARPNFLSFFNFYDFTLIHPHFIVIKLGHFTGFAIMDFLIYNLLKKHKASLMISISFAFLTEFLQLFFGRDGRLYDLMIDSFGIFTVFFLLKKWEETNPLVKAHKAQWATHPDQQKK